MDKVKFNIGFQYLGDEYGLLPFIDIKYIDDDGKEFDALENVVFNKMVNNQLYASETEKEVLKLIEKSGFSAIDITCAGVMNNGGSYVAPKGSFSKSVLEIPSRVGINNKILLNQDISIQDKCSIISKMFLNMYYRSKKKESIGFSQNDKQSFDFDFFYGDINIKDMESFSSNMEGMLYTMLVNHHNRRTEQFINEVNSKKI